MVGRNATVAGSREDGKALRLMIEDEAEVKVL